MKKIKPPTPAQVRAARESARLTQAEAAMLVHLTGPKRWVEYESGARRMDLARWELFLLKSAHYAEFCDLIGRTEAPPPRKPGRPPSWAAKRPSLLTRSKRA